MIYTNQIKRDKVKEASSTQWIKDMATELERIYIALHLLPNIYTVRVT